MKIHLERELAEIRCRGTCYTLVFMHVSMHVVASCTLSARRAGFTELNSGAADALARAIRPGRRHLQDAVGYFSRDVITNGPQTQAVARHIRRTSHGAEVQAR
jgi:hypothetical protein